MNAMISKYRALPDTYYEGPSARVTPADFDERFKADAPGKSGTNVDGYAEYQFWEWFSGSSVLSKKAADRGVSHLPPVDFRYGWSVARLVDQIQLLFGVLVMGVSTLFAAPFCHPWGQNSKSTPEPQRAEKRRPEVLMGRTYIIENSAFSDVFTSTESPLRLLRSITHHVRRVDQCMYGAEIDNQPIRKSTHFQSNRSLGSDTLCDGAHHHLHLRGQTGGNSRTAMAAQYPDALCDGLLHDLSADGGSRGQRWGSQHPPDHCTDQLKTTNHMAEKCDMIDAALVRLRTKAQGRGMMHLWRQLVDPWLSIFAQSRPGTSTDMSAKAGTSTTAASRVPEPLAGTSGEPALGVPEPEADVALAAASKEPQTAAGTSGELAQRF
eukprot:6435466-Pyramimonas_sp.AAC.1